jgi:hypothetical protein
MADAPRLPGLNVDVLRRAAEANMRYYQAWGDLARQWLDEITAVSRDVLSKTAPASTAARTVSVAPAAAAQPAAPPAGAAALVLEASAGAEATGAFLVENHLGHPVDAAMLADPIEGADDVVLQFEPPGVSLAPHESAVVKVRVIVPSGLSAGVDHRTTLRVPGLPGTSIPVVVRRTDS